ncbi:MAG: hypothetical protein AseanaTS_02830 [Candidatus Pelagadaptatus aseana]|uniref:hypothetical protein n=1 Tax=Candidatus Pelagadaptatus aseana TaxID=3120508 RepID=UPI0039B2280B
MSMIDIFAGASARRHIEHNGLRPEHIATVFGASGAAKWLAIYGLDQVILNQWLPQSEQPVKLFGTSVGAFKLASACHADGNAAMASLAQNYIHQSYPGDHIGPDEIEREFKKITEGIISADKADEVLSHPKYRFSCGAVRCHGGLASTSQTRQKLAATGAALKNVTGRRGLVKQLDRVVFCDPRAEFPIAGVDGYRTDKVELTRDNFTPAVKASGSIPIYMHEVRDIGGAGPGVYRDGGMLDYHPVPGNLWQSDELILYPHFYPYCKEGWFDKLLKWRKAPAELMDNVIMISPSQQFLDAIELGRIPDRADFVTMADNNDERIRLWQEVVDRTAEMGEDFLSWVNSDNLIARVKPI